MKYALIRAALLVTLAAAGNPAQSDAKVDPQEGDLLRVGLNGQACAFSTVTSAVAAAQSGDEIFIEAGTYNERPGLVSGKEITLQASEPDTNCAQPVVSSSDRVVIDGTGVADFIGAGGLFDIRAGSSVSLRSVDLINGTTGQGGLVAVQDSTFSIFEGTLSNGTASSDQVNTAISFDTDEPAGGCIYAENSTIDLQVAELSDCQVIGPSGGQDPADGDGGAIHARLGSIVEGFRASFFSNAARNGGAISLLDSSADVRETGFSGNTATANGGAMAAFFSDVEFGFNTGFATNSSLRGGAVFSQAGTVEFTDSAAFLDNSADTGGAIATLNSDLAIRPPNPVGAPTRFEGNTATNFSGAIDLFGDGAGLLPGPTIDNARFIDNSAGPQGGAISLVGVSDVEIVDTVFDANSSGEGGAIYQEDSTSTIRSSSTCRAFEFADPNRYCSEFLDNSATGGSAIHYRDGSSGDVFTTSFIGNSGPNAVQLVESSTTDTAVRMESVWLHANAGDAVQVANEAVFEVSHGTFSNNGGSAFVGLDGSSLSMFNSIAFENDIGGVSSLGTGAVSTGCNFDQSGQVGPTTDPMLITTFDGEAHLSLPSPAVDACPEENDWPVDLEGRTRVFDGAADAGAFELGETFFASSFESPPSTIGQPTTSSR